jgi:hypothetical protein
LSGSVASPATAPGGDNAGGSAQADFDSLIDLITSTVETDSWQENGTGEGQIMPFAINGVYVDARQSLKLTAAASRGAPAWSPPPESATPAGDAARRAAGLRVVSLPRLEAAIAARQAAHQPLDEAMLALAGLQRVEWVAAPPGSGEVLLAGPAGDWRLEPGGVVTSVDAGVPLVRLDDLIALWRRERQSRGAAFGCSIVPRQAGLARVQEVVAAQADRPLAAGERRAWLAELAAALGPQDVEFYQTPADSRIAAVLLAADYHMKLIGMGLEPGVPGVRSYLSTVRLGPEGAPPPMTVLRWWFALAPLEIAVDDAQQAFRMPAQCVRVLSENELLAAHGRRIHTNASEELNAAFAASFTAEFAALCAKYSIYGELARLFELAAAVALIEREGLAERAGWTPGLLVDAQRLRLPRTATPTTVDTVINHRVIARRHVVAGVSGGVWVDAAIETVPRSERLAAEGLIPATPDAPHAPVSWWWDVAAEAVAP